MSNLVALRRPILLLLGPVELANLTAGTVSAGRTVNELLEPLAFIHLHPGSPTSEFRVALSGRTYNFNELASRLRSYLGNASDDTKLFPLARREGGLRYYELHPDFYSDWAHLQSLIAGGINTASTNHLTQAMQLIRGRPLASIAPELWPWSDEWREEATAVVVDIAHELTNRGIGRSDLQAARWAVQRGRIVDPDNEGLARLELRVERLAGNASRVHQVAQRIIATARTAGVQLDPETIELLHEIRDGQRRRAQ